MPSDGDRLSKLEAQSQDQTNRLDRIENKLDFVIDKKADKSEVQTTQDDIKEINKGLLNQARTSFNQSVGLFVTMAIALISLITSLLMKR